MAGEITWPTLPTPQTATTTTNYLNNSNSTSNSNQLTSGSGGQQTTTTQQQNATGGAANNATGAQAQANIYQPWQQDLQQKAGDAAGSFLTSGNLPGTFGAPPQVSQAFTDNWKQNVAPMLATQYGAGSPALGASLAHGLEQLDAQVYQNQSNAFQGALGQAGSLAFNATGQTGNTSQAGSSTNYQNQNMDSYTNNNWQTLQDQVTNMANAASNTGSTNSFMSSMGPSNA